MRTLILLLVGGLARSGVVMARPAAQQQHVLQDNHHVEHRTTPRRLQGRFLHLTDLHPDQFYKVHSATDEDSACHRGKGLAGTYGAEKSECDSSQSLIDETFAWIDKNLKDQIDFVIWTGDSARHDSDEDIPRAPAQILDANRMVAQKVLDVFSDPTDNGLIIPVIPTLGNNDILPHNVLLPGPNQWLSYYEDIWRRFIPEEQLHSFGFGGYFYVEVIPNRLAVFSLNTLYFFDRNSGVDDCISPSEPGFKQLEWLRIQLQFMRDRGMKAILMGHVPPARTDSKQLWDETCWQKYTLWLRQYRDVVISGIYGHMNIDHFLLHDAKEIKIDSIGATENVERQAMEDELSIASTADYLQEQRIRWSKLPKPRLFEADEENAYEEAPEGGEEDDDMTELKKRSKHKKPKKPKGGLWGEQFQLSLVGPSVVPNYFPTLRVFKYNISGLETAATWVDRHSLPETDDGAEIWNMPDTNEETLVERSSELGQSDLEASKKKKKSKKPKDPNLVVPSPPSSTTRPGPAYSPQTLSLTGWTQYFANLTYINNEPEPPAESDGGKKKKRQPKKPHADPLPFSYEVEYSTFTDKVFHMTDLTVNSFVKLAYRMGRNTAKVKADDESVANSESGDDVKEEKKGKKKKKKRKQNEVWLHFLQHAFVHTVERDELEKLDER